MRLLLLLVALATRVSAYVAGDGTSLVFWDSQKKVIPTASMPDAATFDLTFDQVPNFDAFTTQTFISTLRLKPEFFDWMCPSLCGGHSAADYLAMAANTTAASDCSTAWYNGALTAKGDIPSTQWKERCMFWHVNIHSCPAVDPSGKATFCTPYIGKTTAGGVTLATHSPAQSMKGSYVGADIVQQATFVTAVSSVSANAQDFVTIAHYKFGISPNSVSIAAGWAHKINSFSYKTQCPTGFVPNPDGTCAVCPVGHRAAHPTLVGTAAYTRTQSDTVTNVDAGTWTLSEFSDTTFCVACPRGSFWPQQVPKSLMATDVCTPCSVGQFQGNTEQTSCDSCSAGYYADKAGLESCFPCSKGSYQPGTAKSECIRAEDGKYVDEKAQTSTKSCPHPSMTTNGEGRTGPNECVCAAGTYMLVATPTADSGTECVACPAGFVCDGGRVKRGELPDGTAQWRHKMPVLKPGFYATLEKPFEAYDCRNEVRCPGGNEPSWDWASAHTPMCVSQATDINCARCNDGYFLTEQNSKCATCEATHTLLFFVLVIAGFTAFFTIYYIANSPLTVEMSPLLSASISLGVTVSMLQSLGMVASLALTWPSPIKEILGFMKLLVFDMGEFGTDCMTGDAPLSKLMGKQCLPVFIFGGYFLYWKVGGMDPAKCMNSAGMLFVGLFAAFALGAFSPFSCYAGPNGRSVVQAQPSVHCEMSDPAYPAMFVIGLLTFFAYPIGGLARIFYVIKMAPANSLSDWFIRCNRFLFFRFRPDRYYWMPFLLLRNTLIGFPAVLFQEPQAQALAVICIMIVALAGQSFHWPWRSTELNYYDACSMFAIIMIISFWFPTSPEVEGSTRAYSSMSAGLLILLFSVTGLVFAKVGLRILSEHGKNLAKPKPENFQTVMDLMTSLIQHFRELPEDTWEQDAGTVLKEFTKYDVKGAIRTFSLLELLLADDTNRVKLMAGQSNYKMQRILFRLPDPDTGDDGGAASRKQMRPSTESAPEGM